MDITALPFDADAMLAGLRPWVECESPSWDAAAVGRMMDLACHELSLLGANVERIPGRMGFGDCVRARLPHPGVDGKNQSGNSQKGLLILGHMDTVHPSGTLQKLPFRHADGRCTGPGICDMKGGNFLALEALGQLSRAGITPSLPVTVLFTSDEEVGSPSTRGLIEAEASRAAAVLIPEPSRRGGGIVSGRYAIARYRIVVEGRPSHAGLRLDEGRSAIHRLALHIPQIEAMTTPDCTFSVGVIRTGQWVNCVSSIVEAEVLSMAKTEADLEAGNARLMGFNGEHAGITTRVERSLTRPVWPAGQPATLQLVAMAEAFAKQLGEPFFHESSGGGSDGNFTGAMGVPTLDGLGVCGDKYHTLEEYIEVESLASRGRIFAGLLAGIRGFDG